MVLKVDQSIKVEQTSQDTVLALSNDKQFAIVIPAYVKREALAHLRQKRWYGQRATLACFAAGLSLLLKQCNAPSDPIVIDQEYQGHERDIKSILLRQLSRAGIDIAEDMIAFGRVGKSSGAHRLAWAVHRGKRASNHTVTLEEFLGML